MGMDERQKGLVKDKKHRIDLPSSFLCSAAIIVEVDLDVEVVFACRSLED